MLEMRNFKCYNCGERKIFHFVEMNIKGFCRFIEFKQKQPEDFSGKQKGDNSQCSEFCAEKNRYPFAIFCTSSNQRKRNDQKRKLYAIKK